MFRLSTPLTYIRRIHSSVPSHNTHQTNAFVCPLTQRTSDDVSSVHSHNTHQTILRLSTHTTLIKRYFVCPLTQHSSDDTHTNSISAKAQYSKENQTNTLYIQTTSETLNGSDECQPIPRLNLGHKEASDDTSTHTQRIPKTHRSIRRYPYTRNSNQNSWEHQTIPPHTQT